jgi:cell division transport system permease protein
VSTLIGATNAFVRRPFLYHGALLGFIGGLVAWAFVWGAMRALNGPLTDVSNLYGSRWALEALAPADVASLLAFSAILGWLGAWLSVARHLLELHPR